jgi:hypothetical protein
VHPRLRFTLLRPCATTPPTGLAPLGAGGVETRGQPSASGVLVPSPETVAMDHRGRHP